MRHRNAQASLPPPMLLVTPSATCCWARSCAGTSVSGGLHARRGSGSAIVLCVGGAREALLAEPGTFEIVLGKRLVRCGAASLAHFHPRRSLLPWEGCKRGGRRATR